MTTAQIGQHIKARRQELGVNQQTLSDLCGISINTILAVERGSGNPSLETLQRIVSTPGLELDIH